MKTLIRWAIRVRVDLTALFDQSIQEERPWVIHLGAKRWPHQLLKPINFSLLAHPLEQLKQLKLPMPVYSLLTLQPLKILEQLKLLESTSLSSLSSSSSSLSLSSLSTLSYLSRSQASSSLSLSSFGGTPTCLGDVSGSTHTEN